MNTSRLDQIGPTEAAIYRTPEGTAFVDVLASKNSSRVPDRNVKDYDTLKWETELRAQLAQKKGHSKKVTAEEQSKMNTQLAKEAAIRADVARLDRKLKRGMGIIQSLATGPPTEAATWMGPAVRGLLEVMSAGAGLIVGHHASMSYLSCSEQVTSRLGMLRTSVGAATLRALGISQLPSEWEEEPLGGKSDEDHDFTRPANRNTKIWSREFCTGSGSWENNDLLTR